MKSSNKKYLLYMLLSSNTSFYVGVTTEDAVTAFGRHIRGEFEQTRTALPTFMVYEEYFDNECDALKKLKSIKKMNKDRRMKLVRSGLKNYIGDWIGSADKVQILLHKDHDINGIRYLKENPHVDYIHCFNPDCPKGCKDGYAIISKNNLVVYDRPTKKMDSKEVSLKTYEIQAE